MSGTEKISQGTAALPTSIDVARRAGVSQAAVSLVFGGKADGRVGRRTREAILRAAEELGYRPNRVARTLRSGRSRLVILAVPDVSNPYFAAVLQGAEQAARRDDYAILLAGVRDEHDWQHVVLDALTSHAVDGCLLYVDLPGMAHASTLLRGKTVLVDRSHSVLATLQLDVRAGVQAAMNHLFALGHTRVAHLGAVIEHETFQLRHAAYRAAMQAASLAVPDVYEERAAFLLEDACAAAYRLLTRVEAPSAVLCDSDMLAVGVYKAAHKLGRRIPEDLSVIGFDDSLVASILEPELTTVAIPTTRIGEEAFLLLRSLLEGRPIPTPVLMPLELVIRASTAVFSRGGKCMRAGYDYVGVGVGAMVFNEAGEVFLARRGPHASNERGTWEFPGGKIGFGERLAQAITREFVEEYGMTIELGELLGVSDHILEREQQHWVSPTFLARHVAGTPQILEPGKCSEIGWFSLTALPEPFSQVTMDAVRMYRARSEKERS